MELDALLPWSPRDIDALLRLQPLRASTFRSRHASPNARGTVFGRQLLGQALMAASMTTPPGRDVTAMQFMFLQSATPESPVDYEVTALQDGKRFASRHVRGTQAGDASSRRRVVLDAQVSCRLRRSGQD
jgi:acyl-CoA thioesterase-2